MDTASNSKIKWVETVSYLMDEQFRIPGTNFRFGLDPIINLIPVVGDLSGFVVSATMVATMARHGVSGKVLTLMILNIIADATIGAIPVIGQIFDFTFKANARNIRLLRSHYVEGKHKGSGKGVIAGLLLILFLVFILLTLATWKLIEWIAGYF
jgi:hypothetical protein